MRKCLTSVHTSLICHRKRGQVVKYVLINSLSPFTLQFSPFSHFPGKTERKESFWFWFWGKKEESIKIHTEEENGVTFLEFRVSSSSDLIFCSDLASLCKLIVLCVRFVLYIVISQSRLSGYIEVGKKLVRIFSVCFNWNFKLFFCECILRSEFHFFFSFIFYLRSSFWIHGQA